MVGSPGELDDMDQCQEFILRSKSRHQTQRLSSASQLLASGSFHYSPRHSEKCLNFMLQQQQQNDTQRAAAAAAAAGLMLGGEDLHQFGRSIMDRNDFSSITGVGVVNLGSRQIYLTFPTDSTFREKDVSTYFRKQQLMEREEFSPSTTPSGHDHRDPYDVQLSMQMQGNPMMMYSTHDLLRRKMEEQAELQQAIELQSRKLLGLHLFYGNKHHRRNLSTGDTPIHSPTYPHAFVNQNYAILTSSSPNQNSPADQEDSCASSDIATSLANFIDHNSK